MYEEIVRKYYSAILSYCYMNLNNDIHTAEDCTQDVFLLLYTKLNQLNLTTNIQGWLYAIADRKIKEYRRKFPITEETIPEPSSEPDWISSDSETILDALEADEYQLLASYYSGTDRRELAKKLGLTLNALYIRINRIKEKLRKMQDEMHK